MNTLVLYDVENDGIRQKCADFCFDYGLDRIQYSAFLGRLTSNRRQELFSKLQKLMGKNRGAVRVFVIGDRDFSQQMQFDTGMWT